MNARRIQNSTEIVDNEICYWKAEYPESKPVWFMYFPGAGIGTLSQHAITEHEDGTITVSPSILMEGHMTAQNGEHWSKTIHGYMERGIWRDV